MSSLPDPDGAVPRERLVAIVGRPNVGKSALFNRITGRRVAIVHDESGVTRDRIVCEARWDDERFELVDTGGVRVSTGEHAGDSIESGVRSQVDAALDTAAVVILVVDGMEGLHPIDAEVAQLVRVRGLPCYIAVNKCDEPRHDAAVHDFASLGFACFPVSAMHNRGFGELLEAALPHLPARTNPTVAQPLKVAIVGRPNAGKSSYVNRLLRSDRVIVSEVAGTTRDSVEIPFTIGAGAQARHYRLIDTAGMRHVHSIDSSVERFSLFRAERSVKDADVVVLVMDAEVGPTLQDKHIAALIQENQKGCVLLVNKWDLAQAKGVTQTKAEPALRAMMPFMGYCPVVFVSSKEGYNVRRSIEVIDEVAGQTRLQLPTGMLNRVVNEATERVHPVAVNRKRLNVFYVVQTGVAPITLRVFVNDVKLVHRNYTEYLIRAIRERFGLAGAPVVVRYRSRTRPENPFVPPAKAKPAGRSGAGRPGRAQRRRGKHG